MSNFTRKIMLLLLLTEFFSGTVLGQSQLSEVSPGSGKERTTSTTV